MAVTNQVELQREMLIEIARRAVAIDGIQIRFGVPASGNPARRDDAATNAATVLQAIEFGPGGPKVRKPPRPRAKKRRGRLGRAVRRGRALVGKILRGFGRRGKARPRKPSRPKGERPVIRHVAAANRGDMADGFKAAAKQALAGKDALGDVKVLTRRLADLTRERLVAVGAVETGQTRDAIDALFIKVRR